MIDVSGPSPQLARELPASSPPRIFAVYCIPHVSKMSPKPIKPSNSAQMIRD